MSVSVGGLIGVYGGMLCGLFGWWIGRRKAKKQRGLDEVHDHIWHKARSYSWYATLGGIYIFLTFAVLGIELSLAMVLSLLLLIHLASWGITGIVLTIKMHSPEQYEQNRVLIGIGLLVLAVFIFTIVAIVTADWRFLFLSIPLALFGLIYARKPKEIKG